ncbi:hypothetical protein Tco_1340967, partial [Tanacetum coccineum]
RPADRLKIGKSNLRLSSILKSKEPTLQVALDALKLTSFYNAFEISADVLEIYMQEFWVTISRHHSSLRFKLNGKSHTVNIDNFRDMLMICPKLPGQKFEEPPLEEDILSFIRDLGHSGEIKFLSDVNVNHMHQPWRTFATIINKCLIGKTTALENLVFQVENKNSKKNNDIYYPQFTKVIVDYFMAKDQAIPRRNKMFWHHHLTNQAMLESEAYMTYRAYATGEKTLNPKTTKKKADSEASPKMKTTQETTGKRIKSLAKGDKAAKKKQPAETSMHKGTHEGTGVKPGVPDVPSYNFDDEQISWKSSDEEGDDEVSLNDDDDDVANQDDENQDDDNEQTDSDNDGVEFIHPKFSTYNDDAKQDEEVNEEDSFDPRDEANELYRDVNVNLEGRDTAMIDASLPNVPTTQETEDTHVILTALINPEGQQHSSSVSSGFISNMLNLRPDTGIDLIINLNTEPTSLVDVLVTTIAEPPLISATTHPPPPTPLITHMQQTLVPTLTTVSSSSLQNLPNFGSLFGFDHRLKTLETNFSEFKQMNQFSKAVSSILGIVDAYLANKMNDVVKTAIQLQSDKLRDETQVENEDFLNKLDDNIKKIIKEQVKEQVKAQVSKILLKIEKIINEQLEVEVMTRSSTKSKTSLAIAANLSELEIKKILIKKMESNKSINKSNEQKYLYKELVKAYESDKLILDTYGDTVSFKRCKDDDDKDEEPSAGSNQGSKRRRAGKEPESTSAPKEKTSKTAGMSTKGSKSHHWSTGESARVEEPMHTARDLEEQTHQEFDIGATKEQSNEDTSHHPDWFQKPTKIPTPDHDWNKTLPAGHGPVQPWLSTLAQIEDPHKSINELMDTPLDFSAFVMNWLKVDTQTIELLAGPTFELMKGSCMSLVELEYLFKEVYKATTNQLDWNNPEGQQYPHDL